MQARDWARAAELVDQHAVVEWPVSRERMAGRENYVAVNREYPEGWSIRVLRVIADGDQVVSEVEVPHDTLGVFRAASFWTVSGRPDHPRHRVLDRVRRRGAAGRPAAYVERY